MKFKDFIELQETGTSTEDIAGFKRITIPYVTRAWPTEPEDLYPEVGEKKPKRKFYRVPQIDESLDRFAQAMKVGFNIHNHSDHPNHFSLYSGKPGVKKATTEGDKIIHHFINDWEEWQDKYKEIGASDTASRDAFINKWKSEIGCLDSYTGPMYRGIKMALKTLI